MRSALRHILFWIVLATGCSALLAQPNWTAAGLPGHPYPFQQVWANGDSAIYYAGAVDSFEENSLLQYANGAWEMLGPLDGLIYSVVVYRDTLLVGGDFDYQDQIPAPATCVKWWNGSAWLPFGAFPQYSNVRRLRVINDTLFAVGGFYCSDTTACNGVMQWHGTWTSVGHFPDVNAGSGIQITDIASYGGSLVVIGNADFDSGRSIAYLAGDEWQVLGPGILGGFAGPHALAVYQGDLYVGGQIPLSAGNPGQEIMRWNGSTFEGLGLGLQIAEGNFSSFCDVRAMVEHDGLLFIGGGCNYAGGLESRGVAVWDGTGWCSVPGDITSNNSAIYGMDFYRDTLFAACGWIVKGDSVNMAAKYVGPSYTGACTGPIGVPESEGPEDPQVFPNPTSEVLTISTSSGASLSLTIVDALGRIVHRTAGKSITIDVSDWPRGLYTFHYGSYPAKRVMVQ
jgi:hypothetical protein